jgi:hypothetical protein
MRSWLLFYYRGSEADDYVELSVYSASPDQG